MQQTQFQGCVSVRWFLAALVRNGQQTLQMLDCLRDISLRRVCVCKLFMSFSLHVFFASFLTDFQELVEVKSSLL